ncbi:MAG: bifunctional (p)ppGpp synthetase/guanosine-3',5'-bis(diphosphate) 3'-pyrophosphohydrolase [Peptococcaceae bacterium]|nr:bifunctional (p)ppGpp synthetase/guanosine-3',5'-bis(diphosphate) 3'-pyrophosphohydrolase [Peptococcaceae bacterium]
MSHQVGFDDLIKVVLENNPQADTVLIEEAYEFAREMHDGQYRKSGEPYIIHPVNVAIILADLGMDDNAIAAGLLHDVVEDTDCSSLDLERKFNKEVAFLVEGVTKLDKIQCHSKEERQLESYRKMFVAMAQDIRVIIIKLADRLHNMRTMSFQSPEKQKRIAQETLEIYSPLADRLGIIKLKWELEDLSLRYLEPEIYYDLVERISMKRQERLEYIDEVIRDLKREMDAVHLEYEIGGRPKHFYSIYRKMVNKHKDLDEIYDLIAIRVLVNTVQDCYIVLGLVHSLWKPVPGRIKDYIAMPKPNLYQSLHTTVIGPRGERFEIQIRTFEMHQIAEYGVAAHWLYKQNGGSEKTKDANQLDWLQKLKELQQDAVDSKEFLDNIKLELFSDSVFVFSPASEVYELPIGSSPLDFAYRVHTEIGNQCVGAKVNGKIVPFDYELQTGDTVEILRSKNSRGPNSNWLKLVKTPQAKNKIRAWLKKNKREENLKAGKDAFEHYVKAHHAGAESVFLNVDNINRICSKLGYKTSDDLYVGIGVGGVSTMQVVNRMRDEFKSALAELETQDSAKEVDAQLNAKSNRRGPGKKNIGGISIQGMGDVDVKFANCCKPVPGDPIVGYITRGSGITVHHRECKNIQSLSDKDRARLIDVNWEGYENSVYEVQIFVEALDRPKITPDVMALINDSHVHIVSITSRVKEHMALMEITAEVSDLQELNIVMEKINAIPDVFTVRRD